jgi:GABA permease
MISLGGIIGAGLFVGSSATLSAMGPAACLSYLLAGIVVLFVMRMLGEMALANPGIGSFTEYTRIGLGNWAGFTNGWLYWYFWVIVVAVEAVAGAGILQRWIPAPVWAIGLVLLSMHERARMKSGRHATPRATTRFALLQLTGRNNG